MGQQMNNVQRMLATSAIQEADPLPQSIDECLALLEHKHIFTKEKVESFWDELLQVCQRAMDVMDRPPSPPAIAIVPPRPVNPLSTFQDGETYEKLYDVAYDNGGALVDAANDSRDTVGNLVGEECLTKLTYEASF